MAKYEISLKKKLNSGREVTKWVPVGFSWTTFFFGPLVALFRQDWKWGCIQLALAIVTSGLSNLVFPFIYNKLYIKELLNQGWEADKETEDKLVENGIY